MDLLSRCILDSSATSDAAIIMKPLNASLSDKAEHLWNESLWVLRQLKGLVCVFVAVSLTVHSAKNQRPYAIEVYVRCQVEVLFGIVVNLKQNERLPFRISFKNISTSLAGTCFKA